MWRRGWCKSCDAAHQAMRISSDPVRAKLNSLRVMHGRVDITRDQLVHILQTHGVTELDKAALRRVKIRKSKNDAPLGVDNCDICIIN